MSHHASRLRRISWARWVWVLLSAAAVSSAAAQECAPLEVAAPPERPRGCSMMERIRGCPRQREWENATRTFTVPMAFSTAQTTDEEMAEWSYPVVGCAGAVVAPTVSLKNVSRLQLTLLSPSGATLLDVDRSLTEQGSIQLDPVELPQSGRYSVSMRSWAPAQVYDGCDRIVHLRCVAHSQHSGHPREVQVAWRGSAELEPMSLGDEWHPALEPRSPLSRRVHLDAGGGALVRVESATRAPVSVRISVARGGVLAERRLSTGSGLLPVPAAAAERDLVVRLALDRADTRPIGVTVVVDSTSGGSPRAVAASSSSQRTLALNVARTGRLAADGENPDRWEFTGRAGGHYLLEVVPSGRSHLVVRASVFNVDTEEVVASRDGVAERVAIPIRTPAPGRYVVEMTGVRIQTPDADGRALYTLTLRQ